MQIIEYTKSFPRIEQYDLNKLPAVAFLGRSNVGKSSLMNSLLNRKKLVQTSRTAGKTRMFNFFTVDKYYWVDMPGYGFANVPEHVRQVWQQRLLDFLLNCPELKLVVHLVDARHDPSAMDLLFQQFLQKNAIHSLIVATKVDQVKPSVKQKSLKTLQNVLQLKQPLLLSSTKHKADKNQIFHQIQSSLQSYS